jgi:hypothetical protein
MAKDHPRRPTGFTPIGDIARAFKDHLWYRTVYLQSSWWLERSRQAKEEAGFRCKCGRTDRPLHVHHRDDRAYEHLGGELAEDLVVLCDLCHERIHGIARGNQPRLPLFGTIPLGVELPICDRAELEARAESKRTPSGYGIGLTWELPDTGAELPPAQSPWALLSKMLIRHEELNDHQCEELMLLFRERIRGDPRRIVGVSLTGRGPVRPPAPPGYWLLSHYDRAMIARDGGPWP